MRIRRKSTHRHRRSLRAYLNKSLRLPLFLLVIFTLLVVGSCLILQSSLIRSVLGVAVANQTQVGNSPTSPRTTPPALNSRQTTPAKSTPVRVEPDWKDYSNPTFGYALKYPPNMFYREGKPAADLLQSVSFHLEQDANAPLYLAPEITTSIYKNPQSQSSAQWLTTHTKPVEGSSALFESVTDQQPMSVGGLECLSFEDRSGGVSSHRILLARNNQVFSILVTDLGDGKLRETFGAMVSTLRWSAPRP